MAFLADLIAAADAASERANASADAALHEVAAEANRVAARMMPMKRNTYEKRAKDHSRKASGESEHRYFR